MTHFLRHLLIAAACAVALPAAAQPQAAEAPTAAPPVAADPVAAPSAAPEAVPAAEPAPAAAPPAPAAAGLVQAPPTGKGNVVFYRPSRIGGMAVSFSIHEGDKWVGKLTNGTYIVLVADPGPHAYSTKSEVTDTLNVEVEAGETIYVEQTIGVGLLSARPHLLPSNHEAFDKFSPKMKAKTPGT